MFFSIFQAILLAIIVMLFLSVVIHRSKYMADYIVHLIRFEHFVHYREGTLSPVSEARLRIVKRKILVLDMDETLIYAKRYRPSRCGDMSGFPYVPWDFSFTIESHTGTFYVYKRPHLDYFLQKVSEWFYICVYTASTEIYANAILDYLESEQRYFCTRLYRGNCIDVLGVRGKFVGVVSMDLQNVILVDNSAMECGLNPNNSIRIKDFVGDPYDFELQNLLPFLDCLRFTHDVRTILKMNTNFPNVLNVLLQLSNPFRNVQRN
ncbi:CTD nuclear envelope phosphatase 1-like [Drosophila willistoni]|uniref:CTD nuclear envelope phosphatase 1-like n=1 Tax=Drosophila willistoni TaxID=7260 RepID=UPI001F080AFE|nr:CTD nuclear envelope phosphatase 1-like [Drosophila willistoni]